MSEAAHRTPSGKDVGGAEINPSPCKVAFSAFDMIFFQQHESLLKFEKAHFNSRNSFYISLCDFGFGPSSSGSISANVSPSSSRSRMRCAIREAAEAAILPTKSSKNVLT